VEKVYKLKSSEEGFKEMVKYCKKLKAINL